MNARIESMDPTRVAFVRHFGPYEEVAGTWQQLCAWAGPKGLLGPDSRMFGVCHDDPDITPAGEIRYDACIEVRDGVGPDGGVGVQTVAGGAYAVATHRGPYTGLADTYRALMGRWMPAHGHVPATDRPCLEFYRNDPNTTPPEELVTDVWVPVRAGT
jgi:AraC family transcriptional regulator